MKKDTVVQDVTVTPRRLQKTETLLCTAEDDQLDWVGFGCPHFSRAEFTELSGCLKGRNLQSGVVVTVFTSRKIQRWADQTGVLKKLTDAGIRVYTDGCLLRYPQSPNRAGTMMTNSAKAANYIYSQSGYLTAYGSIRECLESAIAGKIVRERPAWLSS